MSAPTTRFLHAPAPDQSMGAQSIGVYERSVAVRARVSPFSIAVVLCTLLAGVVAGRVLYRLWERVSVHDHQLASQQTAIQSLTETSTAVSNQANRLNALDATLNEVNDQLKAQSKRVALLEKGQAGIRSQVNAINTRWRDQMAETPKSKPVSAVAVAPPKEQIAPVTAAVQPRANAPQAAIQVRLDKHNETFSPDLKPAPDAIAQIAPNGLVVWMTPRPGFSKAIPTSVIGKVAGLGILVHDWEDGNHYYITDSGSWLAVQH